MSHEDRDDMDGAGAQQPGIRLGGLLRALRRHLNLSQRGLAGRLDVSAGTLGRWESGSRAPTLPELERALALAGWRLVVVDGHGVVVDPMRPDAVVDRAGRNYPAHADVRPVPPGGDGGAQISGLRNQVGPTMEYRRFAGSSAATIRRPLTWRTTRRRCDWCRSGERSRSRKRGAMRGWSAENGRPT